MTSNVVQPIKKEIIALPSGLTLELSLAVPTEAGVKEGNKVAILLHPWSRLGGSMNDPYARAKTYASVAF